SVETDLPDLIGKSDLAFVVVSSDYAKQKRQELKAIKERANGKMVPILYRKYDIGPDGLDLDGIGSLPSVERGIWLSALEEADLEEELTKIVEFVKKKWW
ncbi:MAG: hypothetical protein JNJ57_16710, partial [Saprospiraceae bacterium]|nr:hypothetical protein [Saprospiraceae bacterium]